MSENSYLLQFSEQVSQIVFLAYLTVLRLLELYDLKCQKTHIFAFSVHWSQIVYSIFDRFTFYYNCMTWNQKTRFFAISVHKYHKSCS